MNKTEEYNQALGKALALINYGDKTSKEMFGKLINAGFSEETSGEVVNFLIEDGLINDRRYAEYYIVCYSAKRSKLRIKNDLLAKGIDNELILELLEDCDETNAYEKALNIELNKHNIQSLDEADYKTYGKIYKALYRKGFNMRQREDYI